MTESNNREYKGKIIKGIAGFYYVHVHELGVFECKAKGAFRHDGCKPLVGDDCMMECLDIDRNLGNITALLPRKSELIRPAVANVDRALIVFAITRPAPNLNLLDRFLIMMQNQGLECVVCFSKQDLVGEDEIDFLRKTYEECGNKVVFISTKEGTNLDEVRSLLSGQTTAIAGPSGVGKSTLLNELIGKDYMETGEISRKIDRGKHTTRHSEFFATEIFGEATYLLDTPGFSSLNLPEDVKTTNLCDFYTEFDPYVDYCKFAGCAHISEPVCGVKDALKDGRISPVRYENYVSLYNELKNKRIKF
ncbi:MAG: ribosome small subunit-dependent GTPase A [Lachnospiraceae bacterium]|nr:ribosome small subunit-dependent GTPase A [Lachnospiraceae bacterium]